MLTKLCTYLYSIEEKREIRIGDYDAMLKDEMCIDVIVAPKAGHLLVSRVGGLDVLNIQDGSLVKTLEFEGKCGSMEQHENLFVIAVGNAALTNMLMVTLDSDYNEVSKWKIPFTGADFTIADNKVYVTTTGNLRLEGNIQVFTLEGQQLPSFLWNGSALGIASIPPKTVVFTDHKQHRVYKRRMAPGVKEFEWVADVKAPEWICVGDDGLIWIRSNTNDCLTILNKDGG